MLANIFIMFFYGHLIELFLKINPFSRRQKITLVKKTEREIFLIY